MGLFKDLKRLFSDNYKDGAEAISNKPVVFLDPNDFDVDVINNNANNGVAAGTGQLVGQDNIDAAREMLEEQRPGYEATLTDAQVENLIILSLSRGPFATVINHNGSDFCLINEPLDMIDHKNELMPLLAHTDKSVLGVIPGWDKIWDFAIGAHEGAHCNQPQVSASLPEPQLSMAILQNEVGADQIAVDWLRDNGYEQIAQALIDYRALSAAADPTHASSALIDAPPPATVTADHISAAAGFKDAMFDGVAAAEGISRADAEALLASDPERFLNVVRQEMANGAFDGASNTLTGGNQYMKDYIDDYVGAYQRQVVDPDPRPQHNHGPRHHHGNRFGGHGAVPEELEGSIDYITAAIAFERLKTGDELDPVEERDLRRVVNDPELDPDLREMLEDRYGDMMAEYTEPTVDPDMTPPSVITPGADAQAQAPTLQ